MYSRDTTSNYLLDVDNNNKLPKHTTGDHVLTLSQILDQIATNTHYKAMKSVAF